MIYPRHQEKRPLARAFEKVVGPEFEDPTRSGCRRDRQPLQTSRLPTLRILVQQAVDGQPQGLSALETTRAARTAQPQDKRSDHA